MTTDQLAHTDSLELQALFGECYGSDDPALWNSEVDTEPEIDYIPDMTNASDITKLLQEYPEAFENVLDVPTMDEIFAPVLDSHGLEIEFDRPAGVYHLVNERHGESLLGFNSAFELFSYLWGEFGDDEIALTIDREISVGA